MRAANIINLSVVGFLALGGWLWLSPPWGRGLFLGSLVMAINVWLVGLMLNRLGRPQEGKRSPLLGFFLLKFAGLLAAVGLLLWYVPMSQLAFAAGVTVIMFLFTGEIMVWNRRVAREAG